MITKTESLNETIDNHADVEIDGCLDLDKPTSFFLFAGAGSGKTRSLVKAIRGLRERSGIRMRLRGQQIAVITYTNAACDEITRRLEFDPLICVKTIHSFVWDLIQGFNTDIRKWLKVSLTEEIRTIQEEHTKGRSGTKAAADREQKIVALQKRLDLLDGLSGFVYSPTGENRTRGSLNHAEVIKIGAAFLKTKPLMQELLISKFPVLLIDESQDTSKLLMEAFFAVQAAHDNSFCLGLIGDTMQRIYSDGKVDLGRNLPADWKKPSKVINHRCPHRVVKLINKIRSSAAIDDQQQKARTEASEGHVRFFIVPSLDVNKSECEEQVRKRMAATTGDNEWLRLDGVKVLTLEHHMAAQRLGFAEMFRQLDGVADYKTGLRDGSLPLLRFFSEIVLPLVTAKREGNEFAVAALMRQNSPLLSREALFEIGTNQAAQVKAAKTGVEALLALFTGGAQPTFLAVLNSIADTKLFTIPESLLPFVSDKAASEPTSSETEEADEEESATKTLVAVRAFLDTPFQQIKPYADYVLGDSWFATHQGVKGLEFPRVLVIMDDEGAGGFLFGFEKLFGAKEKSSSDIRNEQDGKETSVDRTRRLFYVTCSRSQNSLALVAYSANAKMVQATLIEQGWFEQLEIELLSLPAVA
ncbi:UvrD-helicase domain-containing protein [Pedosphaera parvula]|uniref:DNA 3'-5' helicase II n=1 Tax=Pedosphaera parvula (strain Ellin514) TaxID=320771 RepID=B9XLR6_PEDPL|nr:UvrD-helicase domain-containing protein [Pedosphaera parvula]EEF59173.1 pathogenesis-related protein [Pedosphaera parvula Ellin514]